MKKSTLFFVALVCLMVQSVNALASDKAIPTNKIPGAAHNFVKKNFINNDIIFASMDMDFTKITYEVRLDDGTQIEFDSKGNWNNVDCEVKAVPANLVPETIANFVKKHYKNVSIVKIEKKRFGFEIELSNDLELKFDKAGNLMEIDD